MTQLELIQEKIKRMPEHWDKILGVLNQLEKEDDDDILGMFKDKSQVMDEMLTDIMNDREKSKLRIQSNE